MTLLDQLRAVVGTEHATDAAEPLARRARSTLPESTLPAIIVRPDAVQQVQDVVRIAARHGRHVYPISGGKNWGYGDACAPRDGAILIDLSRMKRIIEVDTELAYAVIEPGVTQRQLFEHLQDQGLPLWMDCTGAGPDASILGNMIERGFGHSRYGDRFAHCCAMEFVLPDGEILRTGFAAYDGSRAQHVVRHGLGPAIDGLFTQANLGILTRATVWLMPAPESFNVFLVTLRDDEAIAALAEALRRLRLAGTVRSTVHIFNAMRMLGATESFPWDLADGSQPLDLAQPELCGQLMRRNGISAWAASGLLCGSRAEVRAARQTLRRDLRAILGLERVMVIGPRAFRWAMGLRRRLREGGLARRLDKLRLAFELLRGTPSYDTLAGGHWRARGSAGPDRDPLDSGAGMMWVSPVLPMSAVAVGEVESLARTIIHEHGFEYQVTYSLVSDRALCGVMSICFDKSNPVEVERAIRCHNRLVDELMAKGYVPYRGAPATVARCRGDAPDYWRFVGRIKEAVDPDGVIAPGRYLA